jgi:hypothetical protein
VLRRGGPCAREREQGGGEEEGAARHGPALVAGRAPLCAAAWLESDREG